MGEVVDPKLAVSTDAADACDARASRMATGGTKRRIAHVSGDFPDPFEMRKTPVIRSLVELTGEDFHHEVYSLNRIAPRFGEIIGTKGTIRAEQDFAHGLALQYGAFGKGVLHARMLRRLGEELAQKWRTSPPDLLVGHKLTIEGIAVAHASKLLGIPYALTIQGNTDTKILKMRPDLRGLFREVFHGASQIFAFAPWALKEVSEHLGARKDSATILPCPTDLDSPIAPRPNGDGLISVFHLSDYRNKNLANLLAAHGIMQGSDRPIILTIIGDGEASHLAACKKLSAGHAGRSRANVQFAGALDHSELGARLNQATGFVLPSLRESFGLVFIEALFCGLPIIYPSGAAIDGFFDDYPFAIGVDPRDQEGLLAAMNRLIAEEVELKEALREWQTSSHAEQFTRPAIAKGFSQGLEKALNSSEKVRKDRCFLAKQGVGV